MGRLHKVFSSSVPVEAHLVRAALEAAGIAAHVQGEDLVPGAFGMDARTEVFVSEEAVGAAHEILGTALRRDRTGALSLVDPDDRIGRLAISEGSGEVSLADPAQCPRCHAPWEPGFEVCWSCGQPLPSEDGLPER